MIGVDLKPIIEAVNRLADALNRHAAVGPWVEGSDQ